MSIRVLVIDDDRSIRGLFEVLLHRRAMEVNCVENGADALALVRQYEYDAILLDLMMPGMNGFDFLDALRAEEPRMVERTIVVTAFSRQGHPPAVDGTFAVIRKPFDIESLMSVVELCVSEEWER